MHMTQENRLTTAVPPSCKMNGFPGVSEPLTSAQIRDRLAALTQPFPLELVEWRVTNTTRDHRGSRGQVVAYADQRAYTDRLNAIVTPLGWTREYTVQTVQNFERPQ